MNFLYQIINVVYKKSKSVLLDVLIPLYQKVYVVTYQASD